MSWSIKKKYLFFNVWFKETFFISDTSLKLVLMKIKLKIQILINLQIIFYQK